MAMLNVVVLLLFTNLISATLLTDEDVICYAQFQVGNKIRTGFPVTTIPPNCSSWTFAHDGRGTRLSAASLEMYPYSSPDQSYTVINLTLADIQWTSLYVRYQRREADGQSGQLCREVQMLRGDLISELALDCYWMHALRAGTQFTLEYEAVRPSLRDVRKWVFQAPPPPISERSIQLHGQAPFLYVDVSGLPVLVAQWRHYPPLFMDDWKYGMAVWDGRDLRDNATLEGPFRSDVPLNFEFSTESVPGVYRFELTVLSKRCRAGVCYVSRSPDIVVGVVEAEPQTVVVGIVGCVVLIPLFLLILYMWRRQCKPPNNTIKLPVMLIAYSPTRASHMATMVALAEYLRNYCAIDALLDQLDVPETESKDPLQWCNSAFARADFVLVASSPPRCSCLVEQVPGIGVDVLEVLRPRLTASAGPHCFAALLPYCTDQDLPPLPATFRLPVDLDKLLWHVHSGGRSVTAVSALWVRLGPRLNGGRHDLPHKGTALLAAMRRADELLRICKCQDCPIDIPDNVV